VAAELLPGQLLDQFLQRTDATRQRHERIRTLEHQPLAFMHIRRNHHFLNARECVFSGGEEIGNNTSHAAAVIECGCRHRTHQADRAASIHKANAVLGKRFSECFGSLEKARVCSRAGAAINADSLYFCCDVFCCHARDLAPQRKSVKCFGFFQASKRSANARESAKEIAVRGCMPHSNPLYDGQTTEQHVRRRFRQAFH
jgi:hypothetical protein